MCRQIKEHHFVSQMKDQVKYHEEKRKTYFNMWTKAVKSRVSFYLDTPSMTLQSV